MAVLVNAVGLAKRYRAGLVGGRGHVALSGVDLAVERGATLGLVGESGSGKTTLARILLGLVRPDAGRVEYDGHDLAASEPRLRRRLRSRMQIVFQDPASSLDPRLSVRASLDEGLANRGLPKRERRSEAARLLELVGVAAARMDDYPHRFSGGQKQRIAIARCLSAQPEFLVLDEPVSNLDVSVQAQMVNLLVELKRQLGLTYLFISHDLDLVAYLSDRIAVMREGAVVEQGPTRELLDAPAHPYTRSLFAARGRWDDWSALAPQL